MTQFADADPSPLRPGVPAPLMALLIALDDAGILSKAKYRDSLHRLWSELPETDDFETEALSCQNLFEYLDEEKPGCCEIRSVSGDLLKTRRRSDD